MKVITTIVLFVIIAATGLVGLMGDVLFNASMQRHVLLPAAIPNVATDAYTSDVWLLSIEFVPQSTTSPTCTVQDKTAGTPLIAYNAVPLSPNRSFRDERVAHPLFMKGGITWSCTDSTVVGQLVVMY